MFANIKTLGESLANYAETVLGYDEAEFYEFAFGVSGPEYKVKVWEKGADRYGYKILYISGESESDIWADIAKRDGVKMREIKAMAEALTKVESLAGKVSALHTDALLAAIREPLDNMRKLIESK